MYTYDINFTFLHPGLGIYSIYPITLSSNTPIFLKIVIKNVYVAE